MSSDPIRLLIVDTDPSREDTLRDMIARLEGIEGVGVAYNRGTALRLAQDTQPDVMLIDLMLPGFRSIRLIGQVAQSQPEVRLLALSPGDPVHDRIILALEAGARGYICRGASLADMETAVKHVYQGDLWLPPEATYEVLRDTAPELGISSEERRNRLTTVVLGLLPLTGFVAALTALLWRDYWGHIGVRVADLGVDPTTRASEVFVSLLVVLGVFGPLLFVDRWLQLIGEWLEAQPALPKAIARVHTIHLGRVPVGRLLFNRIAAWAAVGTGVVLLGLLLARYAHLILILFVGPAVSTALLASSLGLDDLLPRALQRGPMTQRVLVMLVILVVALLLVLGAEVWLMGPDLRTDGMHGIVAPQVLGLSAKPMTLYDLNGNHPPLGALYLGGNADLYVLYDPCAEVVRLVPVGASRVEMAKEVNCRSEP